MTTLREYILGKYGKKAFDSHERVRQKYLRKVSDYDCPICHGEVCSCPGVSLKKRADIAMDLRSAKSQRRAYKRRK